MGGCDPHNRSFMPAWIDVFGEGEGGRETKVEGNGE